jgi:hypothetical protein
MTQLFRHFASVIRSASPEAILADPSLGGELLLQRVGALAISYAPFDHVSLGARVVIVGITPGAFQAKQALIAARRELLAGKGYADALSAAKVFASFSGPMRTNLVAILDSIGVARCLGIQSTDKLWAEGSALAHFTSALRYPVFFDGANYAGTPSMTETPILRRYLEECLAVEARQLAHALWIPLGSKAAEATHLLVSIGLLKADRVLDGLPHPSGANAERIAYFLGRKTRDALSPKTSPAVLDQARERLIAKVEAASMLGSKKAR